MRVQAQISFVGYDGTGQKHRVSAGDDLDLPPGVDWLDKKLVIPMLEDDPGDTPVVKTTVKRGKK